MVTVNRIYLLPGEYEIEMEIIISLKVAYPTLTTRKATGKIQAKVEAGNTYGIRGREDSQFFFYFYANKWPNYPKGVLVRASSRKRPHR
jgi:hypothetical protein